MLATLVPLHVADWFLVILTDINDRIAAELVRLERNKDRRLGREKQKGGGAADYSAGSPGAPTADDSTPKTKSKGATGGTGRKCANCGQIGHIKTNKKYICPLCAQWLSTS